MTIEEFEKEPYLPEWYTTHKVFTRLDQIINFYDVIFNTSFGFIETPVTGGIINTQCVLYPSLKGTIESIYTILLRGHCNDAFALIRKYSDAIVIDTYKSILVKETYDQFFNNISWEVIANNRVREWINSKSPLMDEHPKKEFKKIMETFPNIFKILNLNPKDNNCLYNKIRNLCNDNMHYNSLKNFLWNDRAYINREKTVAIKLLNNAYSCITFLVSMHFAFIYEYHPEYFMSTDYVDCYLDFDLKPPKDAERWVAPFFKDFFYDVIYKYNSKLGKYLLSLDLMDLDYDSEENK